MRFDRYDGFGRPAEVDDTELVARLMEVVESFGSSAAPEKTPPSRPWR